MNSSTQAVQGGTRLVFDCVEGITNTVERMHETIARGPLPWLSQAPDNSRAHGLIAAGVYSAIRGVNGVIRSGVDQSFRLLPDGAGTADVSTSQVRLVAALNGAFGDHLEASGNVLAQPMQLRANGKTLSLQADALAAAVPEFSPHIVVLVHGLSLSDLSWERKGNACMGRRLQDELGVTPLYLRYNTGRHISTNGQQFAGLLEQLCEAWPVPVESLSLIGHSMGGLLIRSACWYAGEGSWLQYLQRVVCLGTPHHGSSVAKAGHALDAAMQKIPYSKPLAFGRKRSAGIKDLRHGDLLDEDWQCPEPEGRQLGKRKTIPLLPDVDYYFAAATLGRGPDDPLGQLLGDLLVRLDSAVGDHSDDLHRLHIEPENCRIFHEKNHFDLLDDGRVHKQVIDWFSKK